MSWFACVGLPALDGVQRERVVVAVALFSRFQYLAEAVIDELGVEGLGFAAVLPGTGSLSGDAARVGRVGLGVMDLLHLDGVPPVVAEVVEVVRGEARTGAR
jgi:hypothetical protein